MYVYSMTCLLECLIELIAILKLSSQIPARTGGFKILRFKPEAGKIA